MLNLLLFITLTLTLTSFFQFDSATLPLSIIRRPSQRPLSLSVKDFGATGNGVEYDTNPIQSTINACYASSSSDGLPCQVVFPPGNYLTATIYLKSHVILDIHKNATILGGTMIEDYPKEREKWYVVLAEGEVDVGITGGGEINGQGLGFVQKFDQRRNVMVTWNETGACLGKECRPRLVGFIDCKNVRVWDVKLIEPAYWCLHIVRCQNTSVEDVSIYGNFNSPSNDGIDIEDSNNTFITKCHINTADDAICSKTLNGPMHNLTATNCWIRSKSSAIKLGSESLFDFKDLLFDNITIFESHRGLGFLIRDGGNVSDVTFSNINISSMYYDSLWWGNAEPIYVTTCPRNQSSRVGSISNLRFINITATSENGVFLSGSKGRVLSNLKFINVNFTYRRWTNYAGEMLDYRPGCQELVNHSTAGITIEHIDGLVLENVHMRWSEDTSGRWNNPLEFRPSSTVNNIIFLYFSSGLYGG